MGFWKWLVKDVIFKKRHLKSFIKENAEIFEALISIISIISGMGAVYCFLSFIFFAGILLKLISISLAIFLSLLTLYTWYLVNVYIPDRFK